MPSTVWPTIPSVVRLRPRRGSYPVEIRQLLYGRRRSYRALFLVREQTVIVLHVRHTARREASREDLFEPET